MLDIYRGVAGVGPSQVSRPGRGLTWGSCPAGMHRRPVSGRTGRCPETASSTVEPRYGVHWEWAGRIVQVGQRLGTVEVWDGDERIAVHPRGQRAGQRLILRGQWAGLPRGDGWPRREAAAVQIPVQVPVQVPVQIPVGEVEIRSLDMYELAAVGGAR